MIPDPFLELPFFEPWHRDLAARVAAVVREWVEPMAAEADAGDVDAAGRELLRTLGRHHVLRLVAPGAADGGLERPDLRSLAIARELLAAASSVADAVFAVQGLGTFPLLLAADDGLRRRYLPRAVTGERVAAFALTEPGAGSDLGSLEATARRDGDQYVLDGIKTFVSNAGIADFYVVFAATGERRGPGRSGRLSGFVVDADLAGLTVTPIPLLAPHPIGEVRLDACRVPASRLLGAEGDGLRIALATLDLFRPSVGAAACGLASRALTEAVRYAKSRRQFGTPLAQFQATQLALADMQAELEASRLLVYRAAWLKDKGAERIGREGSMAKLVATEAAQRIVDRAVQIHGGSGVRRGAVVERLYREVRALRIYEGTSEIQRLIIANEILKEDSPAGRAPEP